MNIPSGCNRAAKHFPEFRLYGKDSHGGPRRRALRLIIAAFLIVILGGLQPAPGFAEDAAKTGEPTVKRLTLADAVFVALTNNVTLRNAYLDRYLQRIDLQLAERRYYLPTDPALTLSTSQGYTYASPDRVNSLTNAGRLAATLAIPTGGKFDFVWNNGGARPDAGERFGYSSDWSIAFTQPILKGGGLENAAYSVRIARITEERNILALRDTIAATIKTAITAFRNYKTAERQLLIAEMGLVRAKALYEYNKDMIAAGRMAGTEIVQAQADIATQETSLINAKNSLDDARLTLVQAMYIDKGTAFQAIDESELQVVTPSLAEALSLAFRYRTDYFQALKDLEARKLDLAKNTRNRLWSLNLTAGTSDGATGTTFDSYDSALRRAVGSGAERNWNAGLFLEIPLVEMTADRRSYLGSKNDLEKASLSFEKLKRDIEISVQNAVRNVDSNYRSFLSSRQARELADRKLKIEQEKQGAGRTTNFQLVSFQRDLQTAQLNELSGMTTYLNSLTALDDTLGTTLTTWKIEVKKEDDRMPQSETAIGTGTFNPRGLIDGK